MNESVRSTTQQRNPQQQVLAPPTGLRVALVHDWLNGMRGGERVLEQFCLLFPGADVYTLLYEPNRVSPVISGMNVKESSFAKIPKARRHYRNLLPLMPYYVAQLPTAGYDLVISTSHCVAKGCPPPKRGFHLSYIHSPMRYIWDHFEDYRSGIVWKDAALRFFRGPMQRWDVRSAAKVDSFASNSHHIARKIARYWDRSARVIPPPADTDRFQPSGEPAGDYFLVVSALVPYKKVERAIEAARLAKVRLLIVGDGPERERLERAAPKNVRFLGWVEEEELPRYYQRARALLYPHIEDFGITALEAQACGRPVLALRGGGAGETVKEGVTGRFFEQPSAKSLARLLQLHEDKDYDAARIREHAEFFSPENFRRQVMAWINEKAGIAW